MSRTRIVKGKITEIVGGDLTYFSESSISEYAAEVYSENSKTVIKHSGNPGSPPPPPTIAKCAVFFRPTKNWIGEFGFDWVRVNDSKLEVDNSYNGIIGKYGVIYGSKPNAKFTVDSNKYKSILGEYSFFGVYKGRYFVPNMTLTVGQTATLNAIVHIEEAPDKLHYAYNTDVFDITILKKFTKAKGVNFDENSVSIKCKKAFSSPETIRVIATKNKLMQKVGEIKVLPNNTPVEKKVLIIPVEYRKKSGNIKFTNEITYVNNILRQSLIQAKLSTYKSVFKTGSWFSDWFFTTKDKNGNKFIDMSSFRSLHRYLDDDFMSIKENKIYDSYYRVYCMPDSLGLNGVAEDVGQGVKTVIVFQNRDNFTTMVHELLHSMGVYHTFDNDSKYTFEFRKTDNVMDYTHQIGKKRFTTNIWQWRILNKNI
jgi:hypothetical protein